MKHQLLVLLALALATAGLRAEDSAPSYALTTDLTSTTRYFFRGVQPQTAAMLTVGAHRANISGPAQAKTKV
jgi:hypothetical protein